MDFSTITEIIIPALDPNGNQYNFEAVHLDVDGQNLWNADREPEWISLWNGNRSLTFGTSVSITTVTPNTSWGIPALPLKNTTNPKGTFEIRVLLDLKTAVNSCLKTPSAAGNEVLGEFTANVQYTDVPVVISTKNTSRDVYGSDLNFVGLLQKTTSSVPNAGNPSSSGLPLIIGSTVYQSTSSSPKFIRLQIKTIKATSLSVTCKVKGIEYRLV